MSVIVAIRKGNQVAMAADTLTSFGDSEHMPQDNARTAKVGRIGDSLIGGAGWAVYDDILNDFLATRPTPDLSSSRNIFTFFLDFWRALHDHYTFVNDQAATTNTPFGDLDSTFLIANAGGIFTVASDLGVTPLNQYYAIGSGGEYAIGVLYTLYNRTDDITSIATDAVNAAIAMNLQCGGTVDVLKLTT
jgi:ATP-dependent protease HslVU (ClpYQ) peptidase subunit